ncbi:MAG: S-layer homology domain-containing protein [Clostridia bacterium]|nr:S-layer homology domain-containing protein [Clostridia bacterium]
MKKVLAVCLSIVMSFICCSGVFSADTENPSNTLKEMGILKGYPDGSLHLEDTITRAEATALLVRLDNLEFNSSSAFKDMHGHWAEKEVSMAYAAGLVEGTGEETFSPDAKVTVQEFVKMVVTLLGYKDIAESRGGYPVGYLSHANMLGVFHGLKFITTDEINRGDATAILTNCLDIPIMQQSSISFDDKVEYIIADGKYGREYVTLRTRFEEKQD